MKGFYFGGSLIDKASLRSAILYYDFVIHYDAAKFFQHELEHSPSVAEAIDDFYVDTELLREEELLRLIPISAWVNKYWEVFVHLVRRHFYPNEVLDEIISSMKVERLIVIHDPPYSAKMSLPPIHAEFTPKVFGPETHYGGDDALSNLPVGFSDDEFAHENYVTRVTGAIGREVVYGLLGSVEFDAVPFSDVSTYTQCLDWLLHSLAHLELEYSFSRHSHEYQTNVVREALRLEVPTFEALPDEELLAFRERRKDELSAFRLVIDEVAEELQTAQLVGREEAYIQAAIREKLRPRIGALERTIQEQIAELRKKRIENVVMSTITLAAFSALPFETVILPALAALGKWAADETGILIDKLRVKKNSLYLLWELKSRL